MPQNIFVPGVGNLQFPDGMNDDAMKEAIYKNFPNTQPPLMTRAYDATANAASTAGHAVANTLGPLPSMVADNWNKNTNLSGLSDVAGIPEAAWSQVKQGAVALPAVGWATGQALNAGTQALGAAITGNADQAPNPIQVFKDAYGDASEAINNVQLPGGQTIGQLTQPASQVGQRVNQQMNQVQQVLPNAVGNFVQQHTGSQNLGDLAQGAAMLGQNLLMGKAAGGLGRGLAADAAWENAPNGSRTIDGDWRPGAAPASGPIPNTPNAPAPFNPNNFDPAFAGRQAVDADVTGSGPYTQTVNQIGNQVLALRSPVKGLPNFPQNPAGDGPIISGPAQPPITQGNQIDLMKSGTASQLNVSPMGQQMIAKLEGGMKPTAYDDGYGNMTIGIGHMLPKAYDPSKPVPQATLDKWFQQDLTNAQNLVRKAINPNVQLSQPQFDALTSLAFNLKNKSFVNSDVVKFVNQGDFQAAANAFANLNHANGQVSNGLTDRRKAEAQLFSQSPAGGNTFDPTGFHATGLGLQDAQGNPVQAQPAQGVDINQLINEQWPNQSAMSITDDGMQPGPQNLEAANRAKSLTDMLQQPIEGTNQTLADALFPQNAHEIVQAATKNPNASLVDIINANTNLNRAQGLQGAAAKAKQRMYDKIGNEEVPYTGQTVADILFPKDQPQTNQQLQQPAQQQQDQQLKTVEGLAPHQNFPQGQVVQTAEQQPPATIPAHPTPKPVRIGSKRGVETIDTERDSISMAAAKLGGLRLKDLGGDLTEANGKPLKLPQPLGGNGVAFLAHNGSMSKAPDKMREALEEQGYLPHGSTIDDMVSRINEEVQTGHPKHFSLAYNNQAEVDHHYQQQQEIADEKRQLETMTVDQALADPEFKAGFLDLDGLDLDAENDPEAQAFMEMSADEALADPNFKAGFIAEDNRNANTTGTQHPQQAVSNEEQPGQAPGQPTSAGSESGSARTAVPAASSGQQSGEAGSTDARLLSGHGESSQQERPVKERDGHSPGRINQSIPVAGEQSGRELALAQPTEESLKHKEQELALKKQELDLKERELELKQKADQQREDFTLTGSDRPADANPNQKDFTEEDWLRERTKDGPTEFHFAGMPSTKQIAQAFRKAFNVRNTDSLSSVQTADAMARAFWYSPVGSIGDIETPTARTLRNMIFSPVTRSASDNALPPDLISRTNYKIGKYGKMLEDALEHLKPTGTAGALLRMGYKLTKAQNIELFRHLENGTNSQALRYTLQGIRDLLKEIHTDMKSAGLDVGEIENYFPHVFDGEKIEKDMPGFVADLIANGYKPSMAQNIANRIVDGEGVADWRNKPARVTTDWEYWKKKVLPDGSVVWAEASEPEPFTPERAGGEKGGASKNSWERARKLELPSDVLEKWLKTDVEAVLARYIRKSVERMEYARMFGKSEMKLTNMVMKILEENKAKPFKEQLPAQEILDRIYGLADALQHKFKPIQNRGAARFNRSLANYEIMLHMGFVALASVSEIAAPAVHHGLFVGAYLKGLGAAFHEGARAVDRLLLNGKLSQSILGELPIVDTLKELGMIKTHAMQAENRFYGEVGKNTQRFMRFTLLENLTDIQRIITHDSIQRVIRRNAKALAKGGLRAAKERMYRKQLIEYGIKPEDAIAWYRGGMRDAAFNEKADYASVRWIHRTITEPNAATKPLHMSDPHLRQTNLFRTFSAAFNNVFLKKMASDLVSRDITLGRKAGIIGGIVAMMALAFFSLYLRQKINGTWDDTKSVARMVLETADRAGFTAQASNAVNVASPYKNGLPDIASRTAGVVLGPAFGDATRVATAFAKGLKSDDYSDFQRELVKSVPVVNNFVPAKSKQ